MGIKDDGFMQALLSPGSLVTLTGAALSVIGWIGYASANPNLSLPTIFYGIPILLGGLALKSSELPPVRRLTTADSHRTLRDLPESEPLRRLLADVVRWRYGLKAHLESSLEALKLWNDDEPPVLTAIEELDCNGRYGLRLLFDCGAVPFERWQERQDRLGRFFGPGLEAVVERRGDAGLSLSLTPSGHAPQ